MEPKVFHEIHEKVENHGEDKLEIIIGLLMAIFAAVLGIAEIADKKAEAGYIVSNNEKAAAFQWYQSKSIKQNIASGQADLLKALAAAGTIKADKADAVKDIVQKLEGNVQRYEKEKNEILGMTEGGEAKHVEGEGKVKSAAYWEARAHTLHSTVNTFGLASLLLQLCLVLGAMCLMIHEAHIRKALLAFFICCGLTGVVCTALAYIKFFAIH